jgi:hypothetical protein
MNAIHGGRVLYAVAGHARQPQRAVGRAIGKTPSPPASSRASTSSSSRQAASAKATAAITEVADRHRLYVMTSRVRRQPRSLRRSTCSTSPTSSCSTSLSAAAPKTRCATSASSGGATARLLLRRRDEALPVFGTIASPLQRRRRERPLPRTSTRSTARPAWALLARAERRTREPRRRSQHPGLTAMIPPSACATSRTSPGPCAAITAQSHAAAGQAASDLWHRVEGALRLLVL